MEDEEGFDDDGNARSSGAAILDFDLEAHVAANHILRKIDRFLDVSSIRQQLAPHDSHLGRPSTDPERIIRMLVIGYVLGIRSKRRLCEEVHLNLAYR